MKTTMRNLIFACAFVFPLAACNTVDPNGNAVAPSVSSVQSVATTICKYVPTAETVAKILTGWAGSVTADAIAGAICNAVTTNPLADGPNRDSYTPNVNGVVIHGHFVN